MKRIFLSAIVILSSFFIRAQSLSINDLSPAIAAYKSGDMEKVKAEAIVVIKKYGDKLPDMMKELSALLPDCEDCNYAWYACVMNRGCVMNGAVTYPCASPCDYARMICIVVCVGIPPDILLQKIRQRGLTGI